MKPSLISRLCCPACRGSLTSEPFEELAGGILVHGILVHRAQHHCCPIRRRNSDAW